MFVYDNYLLSFNEVRVNEYPFMVLTYPKSARFIVDAEPNSVMVNATQIRVAAFSDTAISLSQPFLLFTLLMLCHLSVLFFFRVN